MKIVCGFLIFEYALWKKRQKPRNVGNQQKAF